MGRAGDHEAPVQRLDGDPLGGAAVERPVGRFKVLRQGLQALPTEGTERDRHLHLVALPHVAHLGGAPDADGAAGHPGRGEDRPPFRLHFDVQAVHALPLGLIQLLGRRPDEVEGERRGEEAEGGDGPGPEGQEDVGDFQDLANLPGVNGPGSAEGEEWVGAEVLAALDTVDPGRRRHILVHDAVDSPRGLRQIQPQRGGDALGDSAAGGLHVEAHEAAEEEVGIEIPEQEVGVGHRGLASPQGVARRPGVGAGAVGPDLEQPQAIHPGDGATARADLDHLDDGDADRQPRALLEPVGPRNLEFPGYQRLAPVDDARLGRRPSHVERQEARLAGQFGGPRGSQRAGGRPGFHEADRDALGRLRQGDAAGGEHDVELPPDTQIHELALEVLHVPRHERHHVHVGDGRGGALVLADLGNHVRGAGDGKGGRHLPEQRPQSQLVSGIPVGMEQADRHGLDALGEQAPDDLACAGLVQRLHHAAVGQEPLVHFSAEVARGQRGRGVDEEIVHVVAPLAADLEGVPEAPRREQPRSRALALDEGVGGERRPMDEAADGARRNPHFFEEAHDPGFNALGGVLGGRQELADPDGAARLVDQNKVGEGAADIHPEPVRGGHGGSVPGSNSPRQDTACPGLMYLILDVDA